MLPLPESFDSTSFTPPLLGIQRLKHQIDLIMGLAAAAPTDESASVAVVGGLDAH